MEREGARTGRIFVRIVFIIIRSHIVSIHSTWCSNLTNNTFSMRCNYWFSNGRTKSPINVRFHPFITCKGCILDDFWVRLITREFLKTWDRNLPEDFSRPETAIFGTHTECARSLQDKLALHRPVSPKKDTAVGKQYFCNAMRLWTNYKILWRSIHSDLTWCNGFITFLWLLLYCTVLSLLLGSNEGDFWHLPNECTKYPMMGSNGKIGWCPLETCLGTARASIIRFDHSQRIIWRSYVLDQSFLHGARSSWWSTGNQFTILWFMSRLAGIAHGSVS